MKVILKDIPLQDVQEEIARLEAEHEGYYGQPHGFREIKVDGFDFNCGWNPQEIGKEFFGGSWITSNGNSFSLGINPKGETLVAYEGRRHAVRPEWAKLMMKGNIISFGTLRPDLKPWETAT
jgi:hypothetical protein